MAVGEVGEGDDRVNIEYKYYLYKEIDGVRQYLTPDLVSLTKDKSEADLFLFDQCCRDLRRQDSERTQIHLLAMPPAKE